VSVAFGGEIASVRILGNSEVIQLRPPIEAGTPVAVQLKRMRHADIRATMNTLTGTHSSQSEWTQPRR
jgi:hypothetical protein